MRLSKQSIYELVMVALVLLIMGVVGRMDYNDAMLQTEQYCDMVHKHYWPDYRRNYNHQCTKDGHAR